jgi:hypothetical protein
MCTMSYFNRFFSRQAVGISRLIFTAGIGLSALLFPLNSTAKGDLLVVDSLLDRVLLVSATDGSVINANFISDVPRFQTAINAINSGQNTILISDQVADAVFEYDLSGNYLRTVVSASNGLDNIRGIAVHNGRLYVTVAGGSLNNTIQSFKLDGSDRQTFISSNLDSPWDVFFRGGDVLVSNSGSDDIERFDFNGNFLNTLVASDGASGIDFPQQIFERSNGNLLVGGFSPPAGIFEYLADGTQLNYFSAPGPRAVYELANGKYLYSAGTRLAVFDPITRTSTDIINNTNSSFRYIERLQAVPEPGSWLLCLGLSGLVLSRRRASRVE